MARTLLGNADCLACGREIPIKQAEHGGVSACCPWCDLSAYGKKGTEALGLIMGRIKNRPPVEDPKPAAPAAKPAAPTKPAPASRSTIFG